MENTKFLITIMQSFYLTAKTLKVTCRRQKLTHFKRKLSPVINYICSDLALDVTLKSPS